jgi:hypothetical protein
MLALYQVFLVATDHGYAAFIEFVVDLGDGIFTHAIAVLVFKAGAVHVGWKVVKRVRRKTVAPKAKVEPRFE